MNNYEYFRDNNLIDQPLTIEDLIKFLQTLPKETKVMVGKEISYGYDSYMTWTSLKDDGVYFDGENLYLGEK